MPARLQTKVMAVSVPTQMVYSRSSLTYDAPMENPNLRLSRPLYELLPYLYILAGLLGFLGAWLLAGKIWSDISLVIGIAGLLAGLVILLKRRDYRTNRARYTGASLEDKKPLP